MEVYSCDEMVVSSLEYVKVKVIIDPSDIHPSDAQRARSKGIYSTRNQIYVQASCISILQNLSLSQRRESSCSKTQSWLLLFAEMKKIPLPYDTQESFYRTLCQAEEPGKTSTICIDSAHASNDLYEIQPPMRQPWVTQAKFALFLAGF